MNAQSVANLKNRSPGPLLLLVESNSSARKLLAQTLEKGNCRVAVAKSVAEAAEMIDDLRFIDARVDGLLVGYRLGDGLGCRVIQQFRREFPDIPAAVMTDEDDISFELWTRIRNVAMLRKPSILADLPPWLTQLKASA